MQKYEKKTDDCIILSVFCLDACLLPEFSYGSYLLFRRFFLSFVRYGDCRRGFPAQYAEDVRHLGVGYAGTRVSYRSKSGCRYV